MEPQQPTGPEPQQPAPDTQPPSTPPAAPAPVAQPPVAQPPAAQPPAATPPPAGMPPGAMPPSSSWQGPPIEEGPAPGVRFGGYGARLVGYIVDGLIQGILLVFATIILLAIGVGAATTDANAVAGASVITLVVVWFVITFLYFPYFWTHGGQTPGMKLFRIRVVRDADGGPVGWGAALLRMVGFVISQMVIYIGFLWVFVDRRRRGWFDLIAGTVVIEV